MKKLLRLLLSNLPRGLPAAVRQLGGAGVVASVLTAAGLLLSPAIAQPTVSLAQVPMLALKSTPGLVMLTMSRDHRLFYAAYNDTSDIDGDGLVDVGFKPSITYYGNFVSDRCYDYITSGTNNPLFRPIAMASATGCKVGATQRWHGNWLNWAATSRMDALRRVLYGGFRVVDNATTSGSPSFTSTILQGAYIPNDDHVWGKEFRPGRDTYDITQYTTLATPTAGKQHLFVVVSPTANTGYPFPSTTLAPVLRHITNADMTTERIWYWASADVAQGIGTNPANFTKGGGRAAVAATDRTLKIEACVPIGGVREAGCTGYPSASPTVWKPTGVLHDYSVSDSLKFGLLTGSYQNNYSGGVVRRNIRSFKDEIAASTGQFSDNAGIARTIDRLAIHGWSGSIYDCGYKTTANRSQGDCKSWGAPIGEMMYEGLRFFSGKPAGTTAYLSGVSAGADNTMGFSAPVTWQNPFQSKTTSATYGNPICSRPVQMVIADPLTSFDSDQLPGAYYSPTAGFGTALGANDLAGLNVATEANAIWTSEALGSRSVYIGEAGSGTYDGNPTPKSAAGFSQLRGHAPDETQSQGSFYSAGVARFGRTSGIPVGNPGGTPPVPTVPNQKVDTLAIALGSLTPKIEFPNPNGGKVTIVPLSKAVYSANKNPGQYQATGAITGFYYADYTPTSVSAVVNFSDSDQGTDNETDAQVRYDISLVGTTLTIQMTQLDPAPGGIQSNLGYVITGTTKDGLYLDTRTNTGGAGLIYYLDTLTTTVPPQSPKTVASPLNGGALPTFGTTTTRTFTLPATPSGTGSFIPHDTLWYAAKYGGAGVLDSNGDPTNYFKVTNPANLPAQMGRAFRAAAALANVASTSVTGTGQRSGGNAAVYEATYDSLTWTSRISAFKLLPSGAASNTPLWESSLLIGAPATRTNMFLGRGGTTTPLALSFGGYTSLSPSGSPSEQTDFGNTLIYDYIIGDKTKEERKGGNFRNRGSTSASEYGSVLGDIVNSDPQAISKKDYGYTPGDASYASFLSTITKESLAVGSNDGFFHIFDATADATGGGELFAFMPQAARKGIKDLASPDYSHRYFVDGSVGLGHAKIPVPGDATVTWRSVAVGTGGAGVKTVFAIHTPSSQVYSGNNVLWEINENTTLPIAGTFGNVVGKPAIGKLKNGTWVAIFGNGYNSTAGTANLFVVRLSDGAIIQEIPTYASITNNGLGSAVAVNTTSGNKDTIEYVYAADFKGNIWRFDLSDSNPSLWPSNAARIYTTPTGRPITAEILVGPATGKPSIVGGKMISFGTGSFLNAADITTTSPSQALYGIYDNLLWTLNTSAAVSETALVGMTISMPSTTSDKRTTSTVSTPWYDQSGMKGWVLPFSGTNVALGERVIAPPIRTTVSGLFDAILFTSVVPGTDECVSSLDTWVTGVDAMTGGYTKHLSIPENSVKFTGGSPRGVFVHEGYIYISRTITGTVTPTNTFGTLVGGQTQVCIDGVCNKSDVLALEQNKPVSPAAPAARQVWRQLK